MLPTGWRLPRESVNPRGHGGHWLPCTSYCSISIASTFTQILITQNNIKAKYNDVANVQLKRQTCTTYNTNTARKKRSSRLLLKVFKSCWASMAGLKYSLLLLLTSCTYLPWFLTLGSTFSVYSTGFQPQSWSYFCIFFTDLLLCFDISLGILAAQKMVFNVIKLTHTSPTE